MFSIQPESEMLCKEKSKPVGGVSSQSPDWEQPKVQFYPEWTVWGSRFYFSVCWNIHAAPSLSAGRGWPQAAPRSERPRRTVWRFLREPLSATKHGGTKPEAVLEKQEAIKQVGAERLLGFLDVSSFQTDQSSEEKTQEDRNYSERLQGKGQAGTHYCLQRPLMDENMLGWRRGPRRSKMSDLCCRTHK